MRILLVSQEYPPRTPGGIGSYAWSTARGLAVRGHRVHVLSCLPEQEWSDELVDGVWVHRRGQLPVPPLTRALFARSATAQRLRSALSVRREVRRLRLDVDVVEGPDWMAECLLLPRRLPLVVTLHSPIGVVMPGSGARMNADARIAHRLEALAVRRAVLVTSPSALLARRLQDEGWLSSPVEVIPNSVDLADWPQPPPGQREPTVLAVGRLEGRKAPEVLLAAAAQLLTAVPGLRVVLVGRTSGQLDGLPYDVALRRRAAELGVVCELVDEVPRSELVDWYARARVVALPSRFDNYPMAALEAMACARPVVSTTQTGVAPLVARLRPESVVPPNDPVALAAALAPFLLDGGLADSVGNRARDLVKAVAEEALQRREAAYERAVRAKVCATRGRPVVC